MRCGKLPVFRRQNGKSCRNYVKALMATDANETKDPTPEDIGRFDRRRKGKKLSNKHWSNPHNPDAKIAKMKDGRTHYLDEGGMRRVWLKGHDNIAKRLLKLLLAG